MTDAEFWGEVKAFAKENDMDEILSYMHIMLEKAKEKKLNMTKKGITKYGKEVPLFPGVENWFDRMNKYAHEKNIELEHYIISSGMKEMIEGTKIADKFKFIYACSYAYGKDKNALCPANAVNYTNKTQHLFRINKGIFNFYENEEVNKHQPKEERYINFENMIYIGDGETDVPCMKMVMLQGGHAIAVYNPEKKAKPGANPSSKEIAFQLFKQKRANFTAKANYEEGSHIDVIIKNIIDKLSIRADEERIRGIIKDAIKEQEDNM
jgi:hypothetical protein